MEIYILRHGIAEEAQGGMKDADRALTSEGARKLQSLLRRARTVDVKPAIIVTSPYRRARETAQIAMEILGGSATLVENRALIPESNPEAVWEAIRAYKTEPQLMLVGHEPLLSAVYAHLLGAPGIQIDVKKGSLGRIDVDRFAVQPRGWLRWLIHPKLAGDPG